MKDAMKELVSHQQIMDKVKHEGLTIRLFLIINRTCYVQALTSNWDKRLFVIENLCNCKIFPLVTPKSHSHSWQLFAIVFPDGKLIDACLTMLQNLAKRLKHKKILFIFPCHTEGPMFDEKFISEQGDALPNKEMISNQILRQMEDLSTQLKKKTAVPETIEPKKIWHKRRLEKRKPPMIPRFVPKRIVPPSVPSMLIQPPLRQHELKHPPPYRISTAGAGRSGAHLYPHHKVTFGGGRMVSVDSETGRSTDSIKMQQEDRLGASSGTDDETETLSTYGTTESFHPPGPSPDIASNLVSDIVRIGKTDDDWSRDSDSIHINFALLRPNKDEVWTNEDGLGDTGRTTTDDGYSKGHTATGNRTYDFSYNNDDTFDSEADSEVDVLKPEYNKMQRMGNDIERIMSAAAENSSSSDINTETLDNILKSIDSPDDIKLTMSMLKEEESKKLIAPAKAVFKGDEDDYSDDFSLEDIDGIAENLLKPFDKKESLNTESVQKIHDFISKSNLSLASIGTGEGGDTDRGPAQTRTRTRGASGGSHKEPAELKRVLSRMLGGDLSDRVVSRTGQEFSTDFGQHLKKVTITAGGNTLKNADRFMNFDGGKNENNFDNDHLDYNSTSIRFPMTGDANQNRGSLYSMDSVSFVAQEQYDKQQQLPGDADDSSSASTSSLSLDLPEDPDRVTNMADFSESDFSEMESQVFGKGVSRKMADDKHDNDLLDDAEKGGNVAVKSITAPAILEDDEDSIADLVEEERPRYSSSKKKRTASGHSIKSYKSNRSNKSTVSTFSLSSISNYERKMATVVDETHSQMKMEEEEVEEEEVLVMEDEVVDKVVEIETAAVVHKTLVAEINEIVSEESTPQSGSQSAAVTTTNTSVISPKDSGAPSSAVSEEEEEEEEAKSDTDTYKSSLSGVDDDTNSESYKSSRAHSSSDDHHRDGDFFSSSDSSADADSDSSTYNSTSSRLSRPNTRTRSYKSNEDDEDDDTEDDDSSGSYKSSRSRDSSTSTSEDELDDANEEVKPPQRSVKKLALLSLKPAAAAAVSPASSQPSESRNLSSAASQDNFQQHYEFDLELPKGLSDIENTSTYDSRVSLGELMKDKMSNFGAATFSALMQDSSLPSFDFEDDFSDHEIHEKIEIE